MLKSVSLKKTLKAHTIMIYLKYQLQHVMMNWNYHGSSLMSDIPDYFQYI